MSGLPPRSPHYTLLPLAWACSTSEDRKERQFTTWGRGSQEIINPPTNKGLMNPFKWHFPKILNHAGNARDMIYGGCMVSYTEGHESIYSMILVLYDMCIEKYWMDIN